MSNFNIANQPQAKELWSGIGGHFDSLGQIIHEFLDNSISNFLAFEYVNALIEITLEENSDDTVRIKIEDSGTGIKNINAAFTLGSKAAAESPLNEHGFGLKHALASANPENDSWSICTRTEEDSKNNVYKKISAPYKIENFTGEEISTSKVNWPGKYMTGTVVEFTCAREMYKTIARGLKGGVSAFDTIADILCEDLGFVYAGIIKQGLVNINLKMIDKNKRSIQKRIGVVEPNWNNYLKPGTGEEDIDLGSGIVTIEYIFGEMNEKPARKKFDNSTAKKYYKRNMASSGVEIRVNGRLLAYNLFEEIWGMDKHNSYNYLLITLNLKSNNIKNLPKTKTSKNGFREGDEKLDKLYEWIRSMLSTPSKNTALSNDEKDLFEKLQENLLKYNKDPNKIVDLEKFVFTQTENNKDNVRLDLYTKIDGKIEIYEGKKVQTTAKDVYQLRMYWDGLVFDGISPSKGFLVADKHPESVKKMISYVNDMNDANNNNYNLEAITWEDVLN